MVVDGGGAVAAVLLLWLRDVSVCLALSAGAAAAASGFSSSIIGCLLGSSLASEAEGGGCSVSMFVVLITKSSIMVDVSDFRGCQFLARTNIYGANKDPNLPPPSTKIQHDTSMLTTSSCVADS